MKKTSQYAGKGASNPIGVEGKIHTASGGYYIVDWDNRRFEIGYTDDDIKLVNIIPVFGNRRLLLG